MSNIDVSVSGLDRVLTGLQALKPNLVYRGQRKLQASADRIFNASQREVPVDTGDLKDSGHVEPWVVSEDEMGMDVTYGDGNGYTKYGPLADGYSWFVEEGTVNMAAQPYLGPAFEEESQKLVSYFGDLLDS